MAFPKRRQLDSAEQHATHLREVAVDPEFAQSRIALELSEARRRRGGDLQNIAEELRIRYDHLLALEEARFDDLPGPTYVIGFLRSYAGYLDLDAEDLINRFKTEVSNYGVQQKLHFPAPSEEGRLPTGPLMIVALVLAGAAYAAWFYIASVDRFAGTDVPEVPARIATSVPPSGPAQPAAVVDTTEAAASVAPETMVQPEPTTTADTVAAPERTPVEVATAPQPSVPSGDTPEVGTAADPSPQSPDTTATETADREPKIAQPHDVAVGEASEAITVEVAPDLTADRVASTGSVAAADRTLTEASSETDRAEIALLESTTVGRRGGNSRPVTISRATRSGEVDGPAPVDTAATVAASDAAPAADALSQIPPPTIAATEYVPRVFGQGNVASRIRVRALQESWVQVTGVDNELLLTRILRPGDVYLVPDKPGLVLMTGNAGGIEILVDGNVVPAIGPIAAVRRGVALDAERLLAGEAVLP